MRFIDWFAGVGGFRRGMELCGHECVGFCEFDKFAVMSYTSMHLITEEQRAYLATLDLKARQKEILKEEYRNGEWYASDVRRVYAGDIPDADCWCFGFPCQDISVAGKQLGFTGNRSSLFFRIMYLLGQLEEEKRPTYLFIENVANLLSVNGGWDFARLLTEMDKGGYDAEWQVLNSKYFGVPHNRERCFIIGHLRGRSAAEVFPVEGTNGANSVCGIIGHRDGYHRNMQVFDPEGVTEALDTGAGGGRGHYTIEVIGHARPDAPIHDSDRVLGVGGGVEHTSGKRLQRADKDSVITVGNTNPSGNGMNGNCYYSEGINPTLTTNKGEGNKIAVIVEDLETNRGFNQSNVVHDVNGISRTLIGQGHCGNEPKVAIPVLTPDRAQKRQNGRRFKEDGEEAFTLTSQDRHGVAIGIDDLYTKREPRFYDEEVPTLRSDRYGLKAAVKVEPVETSCNQGIFVKISEDLTVYAVWYPKKQCYIAIRKLTPRECFRLQGWTDDYFERAEFVNSNSQLYKQAGNGVTVNVIKAIAEKF